MPKNGLEFPKRGDNSPSGKARYWKMHHYKHEALARAFKDFDRTNDAKREAITGQRVPEDKRSNSMAELGNGAAKISENLREKTLLADKPPAISTKHPLNFHNTLAHKYYASTEKLIENKSNYRYDKHAHRYSFGAWFLKGGRMISSFFQNNVKSRLAALTKPPTLDLHLVPSSQ